MARLPLIPSRSMIGGLSMLLFAMVLSSGIILWSFAARSWSRESQIILVVATIVSSAVLLALAVYGLRAAPRD